MVVRFFAALLAALLGVGAAHADEARRVALVIGNAAYQSATPLANPRNDAQDVAAALTELGFEVIDGYDLDYLEMRKRIRAFAEALSGAGAGLFFYAGHGLQVDGQNYLAPVDATLSTSESLEFEAIPVNAVLARMEREPRTNFVFLDACRDNPMARGLSRSLGGSRSVGAGGGLAPLETVAAGTLIAFSTAPGAVAADGDGRNSPFTGALLTHIRTPGLEAQQMLRRVRADVLAATDNGQVPWDNSSLTTDFFFAGAPETDGPPPIAPGEPSALQIEVGFWFDVKDTGDPDQIGAYLERYPQGAYAAAATARIRGLQLAAAAPGGDPASLEALYAKLASRGVLVEDPQEPHEFYNNARLYELRSDALNAGKMYARFLGFGLEKIDPHLAYQTYLKAQEGRAGAREVYNELVYDNPDDPLLPYAAALLQTPDRRRARIEAYLEGRPDFAPGVLALADEFSLRRLGSQTVADKRRELELLEQFFGQVEDGDFYRYFMDQRLAQEQLEDAEARLAALRAQGLASLDTPIRMETMLSNAGWTLSFFAAEQVTEVLVAVPGEDFQSLGAGRTTNPMTGAPDANVHYELSMDAGAMDVQVKYRDVRGDLQGPWSFTFDPDTERVGQARQSLEMTRTSWARLSPNSAVDDERLLYFTHLLTYRCAIEEIRYGVNTDAPDTVFPLIAPCDPMNPYATSSDQSNPVRVPDDAAFVSVQLLYADGTLSDVEQYRFRPSP